MEPIKTRIIKAENINNTNWHIFILLLYNSKAEKQQQKMSKKVGASTVNIIESVDFIKPRVSLGNHDRNCL